MLNCIYQIIFYSDTMPSNFAEAVIEAFIKLHEKGLIYQGIELFELFFFPTKGERGGSMFLQSDPGYKVIPVHWC